MDISTVKKYYYKVGKELLECVIVISIYNLKRQSTIIF